MPYNVTQVYVPGGINYTLPETVRKANQARDGLNFEISPSNDLIKRKGFAVKSNNDIGFGVFSYGKWVAIDLSEVAGWGTLAWGTGPWGSVTTKGFGGITDQLVGLDTTLKLWTNGTLNVTYSGSNSATVDISATSSSDIKIIIQDNGSTVYSGSLGDGLSVVTPTITSVATAINALADFTASVNGTGTVPAAYLDFVNSASIATSATVGLNYGYWVTINTPVSNPMTNYTDRVDESDFENASLVPYNGVLYVSTGYTALMKYDGQTYYLAGMPQATLSSVTVDTGTVVSAGFSGSYKYKISHSQVDNILNVHEGLHSLPSAAVDNSAGPYAIDVDIEPIYQVSGYNTGCAIVDGTQTSSGGGTGYETITVDDGSGGAHTLKAGDTAYFYDQNSLQYVQLNVYSVTGSSITVETISPIKVNDNQVISNNLRTQIWRTEAGGTLYYLVEEIPNNSFATSQIYTDTTIDNDLGSVYNDTIRVRATPPRGKYITSWRNQLVISGNPVGGNIVYYSQYADDTSPENFPGVNSFLVGQDTDSTITGLAVLGRNLFIFTDESTYLVEGNLGEQRYEISLFASNIGCVANSTIQVVDDTLIFLSRKGVYRIRPAGGGYSVKSISDEIAPVFDISAPNTYRSYWKRATSTYWPESQKYILFLPIESTRGDGTQYATASSRTWVFDLLRNQWYQWSNINAEGGITIFDDGNLGEVPWFSSREITQNNTYRFNYTKSEIDYADIVSPVAAEYLCQWDFAGNSTLPKIYTELAIDSFRLSSDLNFTPTSTFTINVYKDFNPSTSLLSFSTSPSSDDTQIVEALPLQEMRAIGFKFSDSTLNNQFLISGWSLEMMPYISNIRRS